MTTRRIHVDLDERAIQRLDDLKRTIRFRRRSDVLNLILPQALNNLEKSVREALTEALKQPFEFSSPDHTSLSDRKEI